MSVLLADDNRLITEGIQNLLQAHITWKRVPIPQSHPRSHIPARHLKIIDIKRIGS